VICEDNYGRSKLLKILQKFSCGCLRPVFPVKVSWSVIISLWSRCNNLEWFCSDYREALTSSVDFICLRAWLKIHVPEVSAVAQANTMLISHHISW